MGEDMYDDYLDGTVKLKINEVIWLHGHQDMTLSEAEQLACDFHAKLQSAYIRQANKKESE